MKNKICSRDRLIIIINKTSINLNKSLWILEVYIVESLCLNVHEIKKIEPIHHIK